MPRITQHKKKHEAKQWEALYEKRAAVGASIQGTDCTGRRIFWTLSQLLQNNWDTGRWLSFDPDGLRGTKGTNDRMRIRRLGRTKSEQVWAQRSVPSLCLLLEHAGHSWAPARENTSKYLAFKGGQNAPRRAQFNAIPVRNVQIKHDAATENKLYTGRRAMSSHAPGT